MIVYHGTFLAAALSIEKDGILLGECNPYTDFGQGFYVTEHSEYAINSALRKVRFNIQSGETEKNKLIPAIVSFEFDQVKGAYLEESFLGETLDWLQFVVCNRAGYQYVNAVQSDLHNLDARFPIVRGRIADQQVSIFAREMRKHPRLVTEQDLSAVVYQKTSKQYDYADQISFHTKKAIKDCLQYITYERRQKDNDYE